MKRMVVKAVLKLSIVLAGCVAISECASLDSDLGHTGIVAYALEVSKDTQVQAAKYRFLVDTRNEAKENYDLQKSVTIVDDTETDEYLQKDFQRLQAIAEKSKAEEEEKAKQSLETPSVGNRFITADEYNRQLEYLAKTFNGMTEELQETNEKIEKATEKKKKEAEKRKAQLGAQRLAQEQQYSNEYTVLDTTEQVICDAAYPNVPDGVDVCDSTNRTYMPYTAVTAVNSAQYALLYGETAYTDETTGFRCVDGRYCIAVGSGYCSQIGTKIDLVMEDGSIIPCVMGDAKADIHTDDTHRFQKYDGSVAEFIVDYDYFNRDTEKNAVNTALNQFGKIIKVVVVR